VVPVVVHRRAALADLVLLVRVTTEDRLPVRRLRHMALAVAVARGLPGRMELARREEMAASVFLAAFLDRQPITRVAAVVERTRPLDRVDLAVEETGGLLLASLPVQTVKAVAVAVVATHQVVSPTAATAL